MTSLLRTLNKPEYFFRPIQLLHRLKRFQRPKEARWEKVTTPWGLPLQVCLTENIGISLWHLGVYDLLVTEALHRLTDPGDRAADVGANLGYMTSLLAAKVGPTGWVASFEPHPQLFERFTSNVGLWKDRPIGQIRPHRLGIAERDREDFLSIPAHFSKNMGTASLESTGAIAQSVSRIPVSVRSLDSLFTEGDAPTVMKVDVEGGEAAVFQGAMRLFAKGAIRDILFEEHGKYPTPAMALVQKAGYSLFRLTKTFWGPSLEAPSSSGPAEAWEPPSYLATRDPERAAARLGVRGWKSLR